MSLERKSKLFEKIETTRELVDDSFGLAKRDLELCERVARENLDWGYSICYNSILQAGRAFMFFSGFRTKGVAAHVAVLEFLRENLSGVCDEDFFIIMDNIRKKRHMAIYGQVDTVTRANFDLAYSMAVEFIKRVEDIILGGKDEK